MTREERKEYMKVWKLAHKESEKAKKQVWCAAHKEQTKVYKKAWDAANKEYSRAYNKTDVNSFGQTKYSIRKKSRIILKKSGIKIPGYEIHHCFGYDDPSKFIYISKSLHLKIHQFLRDNNIIADSNHYEQIKHLLDDSVVKYGIDERQRSK